MVMEKGFDTALREICLWEILDDDEHVEQPADDDYEEIAAEIPPGKRD